MFSARQTWIPIAESTTYLPMIFTANVARGSFASTANTMRIQIYNGTPNIDWGDGNITTVTTAGIYTKTYANNTDLKTITIDSPTSNVGFKFTDANRIINVVDFGTIPISNASSMFANARGLTTLATTRTPNFEGNTNASNMMSNCSAFTHSVGNWNMSKVSNTSFMLRGATSFNIDIGSWDMTNVANSSYMFSSATAFNNGGSDSIKNWNMSNVVDASGMFSGAGSFNQPVGSWSPNKLTNAVSMFGAAGSFNNGGNSSFAGWANAANLQNTAFMFSSSGSFNQPVGEINMSNVITISRMFSGATAFNNGGNTNIGSWDTSKVANMELTFYQATPFNQDIGSWNVSNVTVMGSMFNSATAFNNGGSPSINNWNTSNLNNCYGMFNTASSFNQPLGDWDTSKFYLFPGEGTSADYMFYNATVFNQNLSTWCVSNLTYPATNFSTGSALTPENTPVWGTCPP